MAEFKIDIEAIGKKCFEHFEGVLLEKYGMTLDELAELCKAKQDGRLIVLPCKTVFVPTWDAGPDCDGSCPKGFYDEEPCDKCNRGKLFIYERPCRQEHIPLLGKTVFATREEAETATMEVQNDG